MENETKKKGAIGGEGGGVHACVGGLRVDDGG